MTTHEKDTIMTIKNKGQKINQCTGFHSKNTLTPKMIALYTITSLALSWEVSGIWRLHSTSFPAVPCSLRASFHQNCWFGDSLLPLWVGGALRNLSMYLLTVFGVVIWNHWQRVKEYYKLCPSLYHQITNLIDITLPHEMRLSGGNKLCLPLR